MTARSIVLGLFGMGLTACPTRNPIPRQAACSTAEWSASQQLMVGQNGLAYVEWPQIVATRAGTAFFGDNALVLTVTDSGFGRIAGWPRGPGMLAGMIRRSDGQLEPVSLPHHMRAFIGVRAAADRSGTAHVFWGDSQDTTANQSDHLRGLAYASFDGTRWSKSVLVLRDSQIRWDPVYTAILALGNDIHVVMPGERENKHDVIHVRRRANGESVVRRHPFPGRYLALAQANDGALVMAYVHGGSRTDRAVVSAVRSVDGGATWSEPVVLYRTSNAGAYAVRLIPTDAGLYAVWEGSPPLTPGPFVGSTPELHDSIQAAVSRDDGRTWNRITGLSTPAGAAGLVAARGPDNAVHIAYQSGWRDTARVIATAMLRDGEWTEPTSHGPGPFWPTLIALGDSLILTWDDWRSAGPERVPMTQRTLYRCSDRSSAR